MTQTNEASAWALVESQENWLRTLLSRKRLPEGVSRADLLSELRIELFHAFCRSYDSAKAKPSTFVAKVYYRRVDRTIKRLLPPDHAQLASEPIAPTADMRIDAVSELRSSGRLTEIERYLLDHIERHGKVTFTALRQRFPGEFVFDSKQEQADIAKTYVTNILAQIREKLCET